MVPGMIMSGARPNRPTHPSLTEPLWTLIQKCWKGAARDRPVIGDVIKELKGMSVYSLFRESNFLLTLL